MKADIYHYVNITFTYSDIYHYVNITFTYSFKTYENIFNSQIIWANKQTHNTNDTFR